MTDKEKLEMLKENRDKHAVLKGDVGDWIIKQCENSIGRGGEMIYVTEEQAKEITYSFTAGFKDRLLQMEYLRNRTNLDLVTIARIVEGARYEVKRENKVGDIVLRNGMLYEVLEVNVHLVDDRCTLVCKVENREDLAHE
ncbi:hypothetical protein AB1282_00400 [Gottfriedia sp. S16(2024)]|uniref:hypothetical protein n=1 Tax=Gottfriedia sp. S16(2024) TaxID=3162883 RepID=UPI003D22F169